MADGFRSEGRVKLSALCRKCCVPSRVGLKLRSILPRVAGNPVQVPNHQPVSNRQFADQSVVARESSPKTIGVTEVPFFDAEYGDIRHASDREIPEFFVVNLPGGIPRRAQDDICQRHALVQNFDMTLVMSFIPAFIADNRDIQFGLKLVF